MAAAPVRLRRKHAAHRRAATAPPIVRRASGTIRRPPAIARPALPAPSLRGALAPARVVEWLIARRLWIPVLGAMLLGIVFVQVSMLSMNTDIGRSMQRSAALERANASLRADLARLSVGNSITDAAARDGMVVPGTGDYRVLTATPDAARRAAGKLSDPAPVAGSAVTTPQTASTPSAGAAAPSTTGTADPSTSGTPTQTSAAPTQSTTSSATAGTGTGTGTGPIAGANGAVQAPSTSGTPVTSQGGGTAAPGT